MPTNLVGDEKSVRLSVYREYEKTFSSAPIRLMSRAAARMQAMGYPDQATAIGDMDWRTVPPDDPEDPQLRQDWSCLLQEAFAHASGWLAQLSCHPMGYNIDSIGYPSLTRGWSALWRDQVGIELENRGGEIPQIYLFHGGNQALQAALLGVSEARRERTGDGRATVLVPIPTFSCPMDQMALQGLNVVLLPPSSPGMDPDPGDLAQVPEDTEVDGVYLMPITNPTGRTVSPQRLEGFVRAVLERWPHAGIILDSVYVRLHPAHRELLAWTDSPELADSIVYIDSLSKTHGVTGLRSGALLTRSRRLAGGVLRYAQNVMAGPSNMMQAVTYALLAPFVAGDRDLIAHRTALQLRIGRHMQRRRKLLLGRLFARHGELLDPSQPVIPDAASYDWEGSLYAVVRLSDRCLELAEAQGLSPTVAFYLETGYAGVPLPGFCANANLLRHGLVVNAGDPALDSFGREANRYVRLSFGMTPPPAV
jgi:aspartate/methionine/tyrosine aminotransferase